MCKNKRNSLDQPNKSNPAEAVVMRKIAEVIDKELPKLLFNFYERRELNGRLIGRYFIPEDQIKLTLTAFKKLISNFLI